MGKGNRSGEQPLKTTTIKGNSMKTLLSNVITSAATAAIVVGTTQPKGEFHTVKTKYLFVEDILANHILIKMDDDPASVAITPRSVLLDSKTGKSVVLYIPKDEENRSPYVGVVNGKRTKSFDAD